MPTGQIHRQIDHQISIIFLSTWQRERKGGLSMWLIIPSLASSLASSKFQMDMPTNPLTAPRFLHCTALCLQIFVFLFTGFLLSWENVQSNGPDLGFWNLTAWVHIPTPPQFTSALGPWVTKWYWASHFTGLKRNVLISKSNDFHKLGLNKRNNAHRVLGTMLQPTWAPSLSLLWFPLLQRCPKGQGGIWRHNFFLTSEGPHTTQSCNRTCPSLVSHGIERCMAPDGHRRFGASTC